MGSDARFAPLSAWIVALVVVSLAAIAMLVHARTLGAPASARFVEFNLERLAAYRERAQIGSHRLVVMIGTSALKYATNEDDLFARAVSQQVGHSVDVVRIVNNWGVPGDFEPLLPAIRELRPDLLLIQRDLLVTDRPWWRHFLLDADYLKWVLSGRGAWDHRSEDPALVQYDRPCWRRTGVLDVDTQTDRREEWVTLDLDGPDAQALREFVAAAPAADIRVALVDVPRRHDLEAGANGPRQAALASPAVAAAIGDTPSWSAPELPETLYCDISHLSPEGRAVYSTWLERRVADSLAAAASGIAL
jgi:hypothetical protein